MSVRIEVFRPELSAAFAALNRTWLVQFNLLEELDEEQLADPERYFVAGGGQIFVALDRDVLIGTCAAIPHGEGEFELAKLGVLPGYRGQGIARQLVERSIAHAWAQGASRITLISNSQLRAAIGLYESVGFVHTEPPAVLPYDTADVFMALSRP